MRATQVYSVLGWRCILMPNRRHFAATFIENGDKIKLKMMTTGTVTYFKYLKLPLLLKTLISNARLYLRFIIIRFPTMPKNISMRMSKPSSVGLFAV